MPQSAKCPPMTSKVSIPQGHFLCLYNVPTFSATIMTHEVGAYEYFKSLWEPTGASRM